MLKVTYDLYPSIASANHTADSKCNTKIQASFRRDGINILRKVCRRAVVTTVCSSLGDRGDWVDGGPLLLLFLSWDT